MKRKALWAWVQRSSTAAQGTVSPQERWRLSESLCGKLVGDIREQVPLDPVGRVRGNREGRRRPKRETARLRRGP